MLWQTGSEEVPLKQIEEEQNHVKENLKEAYTHLDSYTTHKSPDRVCTLNKVTNVSDFTLLFLQRASCCPSSSCGVKAGMCHLKDGGRSDTTWHVFSRASMQKHARGEKGETEVRNPSPEGRRKEEIRAGERMAPTAWLLNRGFPPCTSSSLRSFCFQKERPFHMVP